MTNQPSDEGQRGHHSQEIWIVYRDVADFPRKQFEILPPLDRGLTIQPLVLPGLFGYADLHINWHQGQVEGTLIRLLTYTEHALTQGEIEELLGGAWGFARDRN